MGDSIMMKSDRLMVEAITNRSGVVQRRYYRKSGQLSGPFLLTFMDTNGEAWDKNLDKLSSIDQVLAQMYMKLRLRTYHGFFSMLPPDYAYWYGWNEMTKDLGEIKELANTIRATHKKPVKK